MTPYIEGDRVRSTVCVDGFIPVGVRGRVVASYPDSPFPADVVFDGWPGRTLPVREDQVEPA